MGKYRDGCRARRQSRPAVGASSTSSSDLDHDEVERLRSVAVDSASVAGVATALSQQKSKSVKTKGNPACSDDDASPSPLKFYQVRARDLLHEYLDNNFDIKCVEYEECELPGAHFVKDVEDDGFHLFRSAPSGLSDRPPQQEAVSTPKRKLQEHNPDESSLMFQASVLATAIDGTTVALQAELAKAKAFASWVLRDAKEEEAKRKEEERIALLKLQRGERWLPSVSKDMQMDSAFGGNSLVKVAAESKRSKDVRKKEAYGKLKSRMGKDAAVK